MPKHAETRHLPYSAEQMFDLVADVGRYPEFLPWVVGTRVHGRTTSGFDADMIVGFKMFREKFSCTVKLDRPGAISVDYVAGPLKHLSNVWTFTPEPGGGASVHFLVDFSFRSRLFETLVGSLFSEAVRRMAAAFEARAAQVYGASSGLSRSSAALTAASRT
jgi:coenzyme Q-binding protein COQ10